MKVLMVTYLFPPRYAGATVQAIYFSKELVRQGMDLVLTANDYENETSVENYEGLKVYKFSTYFKCGPSRFWMLRNIIYMFKVWQLSMKLGSNVILFIGIAGYDSWIFPVFRLFDKKTVLQLTLAGSDDPLSHKERKLGPVFFPFLKNVDKIIPSSTQLKELSLKVGIENEKLELVPFGVNIDKFRRLKPDERKILKEKLGYSKYQYVFLAVGQVEARKGYDFMIKAWKYINQEFPNAVLLIAGPQNNSSNQYYQDLLEYIQSEKISNVKFLGVVKNINEYMRISDCLLHCAHREGLPNTLLEASIASVPIVCRKMEGITSDIILNSNIGRECTTDDPQDFAKLVFALLRERNVDQIDSDFNMLKERFGIEQIAQKYIRLFKGLVSE